MSQFTSAVPFTSPWEEQREKNALGIYARAALRAATPDGPARDWSGYDAVLEDFLHRKRVPLSRSFRVGSISVSFTWHRRLRNA